MSQTKNDIKDLMGLGLSPEQITAQGSNPDTPLSIDLPVDRAEKIRELKFALSGARSELDKLLKQEIPTEDDAKKAYGQELAQMRAVIMALGDELQTTRMNKNNSKFFEFIPSGPNRRMKREFAKSRRMRFTKRKS